MGVHYEEPSPDQISLLAEVRRQYHDQRLGDVTIDLLIAKADENEDTGEPKGNAITVHGMAAYSVTKINPLDLRVQGLADARIIIDGQRWTALSKSTRAALLDHELTHLELRTDKWGNTALDDWGRPKLRIRKHDFQVGWFEEVAERHGRNSIECIQAKELVDDHGQTYFPFMVAEPDPPAETET